MRKIFLSCLSLIFFHSAFAQDHWDIPMVIIPNASFNLASLPKHDYFFASEANPGFGAGALFRSDGTVFVLSGLEFVQANPTMEDKSEIGAEKVSLQFLQLPLMIGMHLAKSENGKRTFHAMIGGMFSTLLSVSENSLGIDKDNLVSDGFNFRLGFGGDLGNFTADINYDILVSHLYDAAGYNNKAKLMCWELMIGYKIPVNRHKYD